MDIASTSATSGQTTATLAGAAATSTDTNQTSFATVLSQAGETTSNASNASDSPAAGKADLVSGRLGIDYKNMGVPYRVVYFDENGQTLTTSPFDAASILELSDKFGIDLNDLTGLGEQLDALDVGYRPYELYPGTGSDHGIDFADLIDGGLGTAYDWREDKNVAAKGASGRQYLERVQALAERLGVESHADVTTGGGIDASRFTSMNAGDGVRSYVAYGSGVAAWYATAEQAGQYADSINGRVAKLATQAASGAATQQPLAAKEATDESPAAAVVSADDGSAAAAAQTDTTLATTAETVPSLTQETATADEAIAAQTDEADAAAAAQVDTTTATAAGKADLVSGRLGIDYKDLGIPYRVVYFDEDGQILTTSSFDAPSILELSDKFGIDLNDLTGLGEQLDALDIGYRPYELYPGTGSDHGIDFADLIDGGLGTAYDWREDKNVAAKGASGRQYLEQVQALAERLGVESHADVTTGGGIDASRFTSMNAGDGLRSYVAYGSGVAAWYATEAQASQYADSINGQVIKLATQVASGAATQQRLAASETANRSSTTIAV